MIRTPSVWRWQLIFVGGLVTMAVMIAGFRPQIYSVSMFLWGLSLVVAVTLVTLIVPWDRLSVHAILAVPLLDTVAIGLMNSAPDLRLGFLWVFPVTWIATYCSLQIVFVEIALITVLIALFGNHAGDATDILLRVLVTVLTLGFLGTTIRIGTRRARATRRLLQRQSAQISRTAARAETHQRRVTQIIDALDTALLAVADDGTILNMNDAYRRLYGRDRFGVAQPALAVEYDDYQGEALPPEQTTLFRAARGEKLRSERIWLFDAEGRWRALEATTEPIANFSSEVRTTLLVIDDITDRLDADAERRTMATIVSHELRNPLTAIIGHVELLLEREDLPDRVGDQLRVIISAGERMERLVSHVLDDGRKESQALSAPVDLRQVVEASVALFVPTSLHSGVTMRIEGEQTLRVTGDAFRLRQVVDNLISNAVKYTSAGGTVIVHLSRTQDGCAQVVVSDTGVGMSEADLTRVFDQYFRAESAVVGDVPGTGLGMGIARDIVTSHGGTIELASTPGEGTSVTLRFPQLAAKKETA